MARGPAAFVHPRNLVTYASVAAALLGTLLADGGAHARARVGACLAIASLADLLDGRFARLFATDDAHRRFGVQIDSLADAVTFGLAPVVCLDRLGAAEAGGRAVFFAAALVYVLAALTRLGFYNVADAEGATGFVGIPTTVCGIAWSAALLAAPGAWTSLVLVALGAAMVAPIALPRPGLRAIATLVLACVGLAAAHARAAF